MSGWAARRFWTTATAVPTDGGFAVHLDARPVRTPLKAPLILPTLALAEAVAAEWQAQAGKVKPDTMPVTRTANSAIDKVAPQHDAVAAMLAAYGESDLLCYRATGPEGLIQRQSEAWDPLLAWAADRLSAPLVVTTGVMHVTQPPDSLAALSRLVHQLDPFRLAAAQGVGRAIQQVAQIALLGRHIDAAAHLGIAQPQVQRPKADVLLYAGAEKLVIRVLENDANAPAQVEQPAASIVDGLAVEADDARVRPQDAVAVEKEARLTRAVVSQDDDALPARERQR